MEVLSFFSVYFWSELSYANQALFDLTWPRVWRSSGVDFINILCTNFSYGRRFSSFSLVTCLVTFCFGKKFVRKTRAYNIDEIDGSGSSQGRSGSNNTATATTTTTANNSHDASTYPATGDKFFFNFIIFFKTGEKFNNKSASRI